MFRHLDPSPVLVHGSLGAAEAAGRHAADSDPAALLPAHVVDGCGASLLEGLLQALLSGAVTVGLCLQWLHCFWSCVARL